MPLHPPGPRRERILVVGYSGSGKSTCWLNLAEWLHKTKADSQLYVLDNDHAWEAMRPLDGHLDDRVHVWEVEGWEEHRAAVREATKQAGRDDWLIGDLAQTFWDDAQNAYWEIAYGKEIDEIFLDVKIENFNMAGDYGNNWGAINKMYASVFEPFKRFKGHVMCCTGGEEVRQASGKAAKLNDSPDIIKAFGKYGIKPVGQKKLSHAFHTILLTQDTPSGFTLTTLKERNPPDRVERESLRADKGAGFTMQYLVKIAKWRMA